MKTSDPRSLAEAAMGGAGVPASEQRLVPGHAVLSEGPLRLVLGGKGINKDLGQLLV